MNNTIKCKNINLCKIIIVVFVITLALISNSITVSAAKKRDIINLCDQLSFFWGKDIFEKMNCGDIKKYNFSKASIRRQALGVCYLSTYQYYGYDKYVDFSNEYSRWLFGETTSNTYYFEGEWGDTDYAIKIKKIKKKKGLYFVNANIYIVAFDEEAINGVSKTKIGELKLKIQNASYSNYNCIMKSAVLKRTAGDDAFNYGI